MPQEMGMYSNLGRAMAGDGQSRSLSAPMIPTTAAPRPMNMGGGMPGGAPGGMPAPGGPPMPPGGSPMGGPGGGPLPPQVVQMILTNPAAMQQLKSAMMGAMGGGPGGGGPGPGEMGGMGPGGF